MSYSPMQFLSVGHDLVVRMWEVFDQSDDNECVRLGAIRCSECTVFMTALVLTLSFLHLNTVPFDARPQDLAYTPDGSTLAITYYDGYVVLYVAVIHIPTNVFQYHSAIFSGPLRGYDRY